MTHQIYISYAFLKSPLLSGKPLSSPTVNLDIPVGLLPNPISVAMLVLQ